MAHLTNRTHPDDIVQIIKRDHKPLKALLVVLKDETAPYVEKKMAFQKFAPLLQAHTKPEQDTWYHCLRRDHGSIVDMKESELEHRLAEQICNDMETTTSERSFLSKASLLAELVDHHIRIEERDLLPDFESATTLEERIGLGRFYLELQQHINSLLSTELRPIPPSSLDNMRG